MDGAISSIARTGSGVNTVSCCVPGVQTTGCPCYFSPLREAAHCCHHHGIKMGPGKIFSLHRGIRFDRRSQNEKRSVPVWGGAAPNRRGRGPQQPVPSSQSRAVFGPLGCLLSDGHKPSRPCPPSQHYERSGMASSLERLELPPSREPSDVRAAAIAGESGSLFR